MSHPVTFGASGQSFSLQSAAIIWPGRFWATEGVGFSLSQESLDTERHVVAVRGEIDLFTAPELKSALSDAIESGRSRIVVDLTDTTFLDSTALGVLIGAVKRLRSRDGRLTIVNVDENIAKTFEITGLDQIFPISSTRDEAIKALADEAPTTP